MSQAMSGSGILKAGDYQLQKLEVHSLTSNQTIDIRMLVSHIEIFEDLFSPYITAKIHMSDGLNLPEFLPIRGQEKIDMVFKTDVEAISPITLTLRVYKLDGQKIDSNGKYQKYTLHLVSEGGYLDYTEYCGYSVGGPVSEMVAGMFKRHFPETLWQNKLDIEPTKDNYRFVLPITYHPFRAINWLATKAINSNSGDFSPFMFYETLDGYNFKSISSIIKSGEKNLGQYFYNTGNIRLPDGRESASPDIVRDTTLPARYHKVQSLEETERFDMVGNLMDGKVTSVLFVHDLVKKEERRVNFHELDVFDKISKTGSQPHFKSKDPHFDKLYKTPAVIDYAPVTSFTVFNQYNGIVDNMKTETTFLNRRFQVSSLLTGQKVVVTVFGDSRRKVGDIVDLYVPKISADAHTHDGDKSDKNLSGRYMVTSVKHMLSTGYSCKMELSKAFLEV